MNGKKIDKETAIKSILSKKKKGVDDKSILQYFTKNYSFSEKTYYNWKKEAETRYRAFLDIAEPIIREKEIEAMGEFAKAGILSKIGRQKILSQIALGEIPLSKYIVCNGVIQEVEVVPNWTDRKNAIAELNKMDGAYLTEDEDASDNTLNITIEEI